VTTERLILERPLAVQKSPGAAEADDERIEGAVREHARLVYRVAYAVLRNVHDAEDATQETFIRVLRQGQALAEVRDLKNWLARVAFRAALDRRRKRREVPLEEADTAEQLPAGGPNAEQALLSAETSALLGTLIRALPETLRDAVTLSTVQEMAHADIALVLGIPEAAVRSRLFRARQILKEKLVRLRGGSHGA